MKSLKFWNTEEFDIASFKWGIKERIDKEILGGSVITVGDTVIDASVKGQLESLAFAMKA